MTSSVHVAWLTLGLVLGALHATAMWRGFQHPTSWSALTGALRRLLLATALTVVALSGGILPTSAGWSLGFLATATTIWSRSRTG